MSLRILLLITTKYDISFGVLKRFRNQIVIVGKMHNFVNILKSNKLYTLKG